MRTIPTLAAIALILAIAAPPAPAGVTCKSTDGTEQQKHILNHGACDAVSDGSGAKAIAHGNGGGASATAQQMGVAIAIAGKKSSATALSAGLGGIAKAISDSGSYSNAESGAGHAKAVSSSGGQSTVSAGNQGTGTAISDHHGVAMVNTFAVCTAKATASTKGFADAECAGDGDEVTAEATGGATASGGDRFAPTCDTTNGGTAKVTSPMGNCN